MYCISIPINKSPDQLYPSQQSNRWNNTDIGGNGTDIGWNDTVFFIVITCIPLDRWNDTDIGGGGNDTEIGWDDTEIGWNDTVFFIVITCIGETGSSCYTPTLIGYVMDISKMKR